MATSNALYDQDFYAWSNQQAALLRAGKLSQADIENIAEEIESMGKSEKRELVNRLIVLMLHLLKWQYQPIGRGASWEASIKGQRLDIERHLRDNPSLKSQLPEAISDAYSRALIDVVGETKLSEDTFPMACPYSFEKMMQKGFWPE